MRSEGDVEKALTDIESKEDFSHEAERLVQEWQSRGLGSGAVAPIVKFIEEHPHLDYGMPGALVHFVEANRDDSYGDILVASVRRRPTRMTIWMVNRVINGECDPAKRLKLIKVLRDVANDDGLEESLVSFATSLLRWVSDGAR